MTQSPATSLYTQNSILLEAQQYVLNLHNQKHNAKLVYHNFAQMSAVIEMVKQLAVHTKRNSKTAEIALLAAYFRSIGYLESYRTPKEKAVQFAKDFLQQQQYPEFLQVLKSIEHSFDHLVKSVPDALLSDALNVVQYGETYREQSELHHLEIEWMQQQKTGKKDWERRELDALMEVQFYTPYGKIHFAPQLAQHIARLKKRVEKNEENEAMKMEESPSKIFGQLELEATDRGVQTFFRTNYRNHINLSAIADNKANIMISVNSILISVLITVLTWRNITETQPEVLMPGVIFLVTALASLIFAVLSARPKVTNMNEQNVDKEKVKKNIVFFGNFVTLSLDQYEEAMDQVLRNDELLYGNMSRDLYFLGKVLSKKYYFLTISYNVFMIGFIVSVVLFLGVLFVR